MHSLGLAELAPLVLVEPQTFSFFENSIKFLGLVA